MEGTDTLEGEQLAVGTQYTPAALTGGTARGRVITRDRAVTWTSPPSPSDISPSLQELEVSTSQAEEVEGFS